MHHIDKKTLSRWSRDSSGQQTSQDLDVMEVRMRAIIQTKVPSICKMDDVCGFCYQTLVVAPHTTPQISSLPPIWKVGCLLALIAWWYPYFRPTTSPLQFSLLLLHTYLTRPSSLSPSLISSALRYCLPGSIFSRIAVVQLSQDTS